MACWPLLERAIPDADDGKTLTLAVETPLVGFAYASRAGFMRSRNVVLKHIERVKKGFGLLILLAGLAVLMGWDKQLEAAVLDLLPEGWVRTTVMF